MTTANHAAWDSAELRCSCGTRLTAHTPAEFEQLITEHLTICTYQRTNPLIDLPCTVTLTAREADA